MKTITFAMSLLLLLGSVAHAQPVLNATKVEAACSLDHNAQFLGVDLVTSYRLTYKDGATIVAVQDGGKPVPSTTNVCTFAPIPASVVGLKNKAVTVTTEVIGATTALVSDPMVSDFFGYVGKPNPSGKPSPKP